MYRSQKCITGKLPILFWLSYFQIVTSMKQVYHSFKEPFISDFAASAKTPSLIVLTWNYHLRETKNGSEGTDGTNNIQVADRFAKPTAFEVHQTGYNQSRYPDRLPRTTYVPYDTTDRFERTFLNDEIAGPSHECGSPERLAEDVACSADSGTCIYYFDNLKCGTLYEFQLSFSDSSSVSTENIAKTMHGTFPCIGTFSTVKIGVYSALFEYHRFVIRNSDQAPHDILFRYDKRYLFPLRRKRSYPHDPGQFCSLYGDLGTNTQISILSLPQIVNGSQTDKVTVVYSIRLSNLKPSTDHFYKVYAPYGSSYIYQPLSSMFSTTIGAPDPPRYLSVDVDSPWNATISWQEPKRDGGASVHYMVEYRNASGSLWVKENVSDTKILVDDSFCDNCEFSARVAAANTAGRSDFVTVTRRPKEAVSSSKVRQITAGVISLAIVMSIITVVSILMYRHHHRRKIVHMIAEFECERHQIILPRELEYLPKVSMENIVVSQELGEGNFGKVFEGFVSNLDGPDSKAMRAAFKTLRINASMADRNELLEEALTMRNMDHPNIIKLLGLCVDGTELWLILEMMDGGDLLSLLRQSRPTETMPSHVSLDNLLRIGCDIARGCEYVSVLGYIHRDLATRNCLVDNRNPDVCTVKIADFGLTRGVYQKCYYRLTENSIFPIRWTAPEVLTEFAFSPRSDVWSFGIILWEIMTLGAYPFQEFTDIEVIKLIKDGKLLPQPDHCPQQIFDIMKSCWILEPDTRPGFAEVSDSLNRTRISQAVDSVNKPYMRSLKRQQEVQYNKTRDDAITYDPSDIADNPPEPQRPFIAPSYGPKTSCIRKVSRVKTFDAPASVENCEFLTTVEPIAETTPSRIQRTQTLLTKTLTCSSQYTSNKRTNVVPPSGYTAFPLAITSDDSMDHFDHPDHFVPEGPSSESGYSSTSDPVPTSKDTSETEYSPDRYTQVKLIYV